VDITNLFDTLKDLKENRRLSSESEEIIKPFVGALYSLTLKFGNASSTFSSRHDDRYSGGKTLVASFLDHDLECSILFPPIKNEWLEGLNEGAEFSADLVVLELDNLYQRIIFGYSFATFENLVGDAPPSLIQAEESMVIQEAEMNNQPVEVVSTQNSEQVNRRTEVGIDSPPNSEKVENRSEVEPRLVEAKTENFNDSTVQEESVSITHGDEDSKEIEFESIKVEEKEKAIILEKTKLPPTIPTLIEQEVQREYDYIEVQRIRDKRYEHGSGSLTSKEKNLLIRDRVENEELRKKNLTEGEKVLNIGARLFFGVIFLILGFNKIAGGWSLFGLIILIISGVILAPLIKKLRNGD
jgi:hypothetical protein